MSQTKLGEEGSLHPVVHAIAQEASVVLVRIILSIACLQVQVEHDIIAEVRVLDSTGQPLSVSFFPLMNLKPNVESDIIEVR